MAQISLNLDDNKDKARCNYARMTFNNMKTSCEFTVFEYNTEYSSCYSVIIRRGSNNVKRETNRSTEREQTRTASEIFQPKCIIKSCKVYRSCY